MARTATISTLQRWARERAGIPVMDRADFVRLGLGGMAGVLLAPSFTYGTSWARSRERVAVIGAGIAGLSCALALHDAGITSTIFESSNRVGGRMHSERTYWDDGQHTEWCGAMIDSKHVTMHALARRFHIPLLDTFAPLAPHARDTAFFDGRYYPMMQADRDFAPVFATLQAQLAKLGPVTTYDSVTPLARELDAMSMAQWIERYIPGGRASRFGKLVEDALVNENGLPAEVQSALNLVYMLGIQEHYTKHGGPMNVLGYSDQRYTTAVGNQRLPEAIAGALPAGSIRFAHRLTAIRKVRGGTYVLRFNTPRGDVTETYDRVVIAIPFVILRNVDYADAGFDARKREAIEELGYGIHTKLHVQFHGRPWTRRGPWPDPVTGQIWTDLGFQCSTDFTLGQRGTSGIVEVFTAGTSGMLDTPPTPYARVGDSPAVARHVARFLEMLERIWPGVSHEWNGKATFGNAQVDPNIQASYAAWKVGQYTRFAGYERTRQGRVHFAGEHTSVENQGFMEGAAQSGIAAAHDILADYNTKVRANA